MRRQRLIGWTLLTAIVVLALGVPLPSATALKTSSEPFPCQSCACNCHSAAFCWDKCCCHSDSEKLDWAAKNGVQPPAFLVARVAKATSLATFEDETASSNAVKQVAATVQKRPACCAHVAKETKSPSVRAEKTTGCDQTAMVVRSSEKPVHGTRVLLWDAIRKCKGIELAVKLLSNTLVHRGGKVACPEPFLLFVCPLLNERLLTRSLQVEPPIP